MRSLYDSKSPFWYSSFGTNVDLSKVDSNLVDGRVNGMIKPRGTKAKQRKPKVAAPAPRSSRVSKSGGEQASSKVGKAQRGNSGPANDAGARRRNEPETLPLALAGRWVAWSGDGLRIIGSGATLVDAEEAAANAGETEPIFERAAGRLRR
jgi:hypothetical protein